SPHQQLALLAGGHVIAVLVDHSQLVVLRKRPALGVVHDVRRIAEARVVQQSLGHVDTWCNPGVNAARTVRRRPPPAWRRRPVASVGPSAAQAPTHTPAPTAWPARAPVP